MTMVPQGGFNFSPHPQLLAETDAYISMGDTAENVARKYEVSRPTRSCWRCNRTRRPPLRAPPVC
jgi:acetyl-CoA acetyltransferase